MKHTMLLATALMLTTLVSTNAWAEPSNSSFNTCHSSFNGSWSTNWGPMYLTEKKGGKITGHYTHDKGKITGTLSPDRKTLNATWSEAPDYKPPGNSGKAVLTLSDDCKKFKGSWGYGNSLSQGDWTGDLISGH